MQKKKNLGQSTLEYVLVVIAVVGALVMMQIYMKRGAEGKIQASARDIGGQFNPYGATVNRTSSLVIQDSDVKPTTTQTVSGGVTSVIQTAETVEEGHNENVTGWNWSEQ